MKTYSFSIGTALGNVFRLQHTKGTRTPILLGWFLVSLVMAAMIITIFKMDMSHLHAVTQMHKNLVMGADAYNPMSQGAMLMKFSLKEKILRSILILCCSFIVTIISAGMIMVAVDKQRGKQPSVGSVFRCFSKSVVFIPFVILSKILTLMIPSPTNLLGFQLSPTWLLHQNDVLIFTTAIILFFFVSFLFALVVPLIADKYESGLLAIKDSVVFMWRRANFLKLCWTIIVLGLAYSVLYMAFVLAVALIAAIVSTYLHAKVLAIILISLLVLVFLFITCLFLPGVSHMNAYVYRSIMGELETGSEIARQDSVDVV
jgi:hypothetical protein